MLDRLAELLPPPPTVPRVDWPAVEDVLSTTLPPDYKAFCDRWGTGEIETSGPVTIYRLPDESAPSQAILAEELEDELLPPMPLFPAPRGVLLWGETESEARLLWRTAPRPEDWEVVVLVVDEPVATGLTFVAWLVAALERRLSAEQLPVELQPDQVLVDGGPRWVPRAPGDIGDAEDDPRPEDVLGGYGSEEVDGRLTPMVELDFGMLPPPRRQALDAFVAQLEPALAARVVDARVDRDGEVVYLRDEAARLPMMRAAVDFVAARLGVPADPHAVDALLPRD